ncbi:hypothetical protein [endosymbiont GvMRE of Glomus versiforme]|uniref:hypothetical protein n=1 Tax=endosymbiont GvMRE of Glomus versiforme TaxID=2039283 RepID=UPI000EEEDE9F|nr:hypothetical protein [endosymbiont GvMRE of Glomus versiforme]RHZ37360.1 hypothetical protein GvMRE_I1g613 [endosymbiont GvMRE of Glomus versiforme]
MRNLKDYLAEKNQIKPNLSREELLELKNLLENLPENQKGKLGTRTRECYLWEVNQKLK